MASKVAEFEHLLGKVPDAKIAEMADVKVDTVARYRKSKGIAELVADGEAPASEAPKAKDDDEEDALDCDRLDAEDLASAVASATEFLTTRGYTVTPPGAKPEQAKPAAVPTTVRALRSAQLRRPGGGLPMRVSFRDVFSGPDAAWLWKHHRNAVEAYPR